MYFFSLFHTPDAIKKNIWEFKVYNYYWLNNALWLVICHTSDTRWLRNLPLSQATLALKMSLTNFMEWLIGTSFTAAPNISFKCFPPKIMADAVT